MHSLLVVIIAMSLLSCAQNKRQEVPPAKKMEDYFATANETNNAVDYDVRDTKDDESDPDNPFATEDELNNQSQVTSSVEENQSADEIEPAEVNPAPPSVVTTRPSSTKDYMIPLKSPEYQMAANEQGIMEQVIGVDGQPILLLKKYDENLIREEIYTLEQFGPNPYLSQATMASNETKESFKKALTDANEGRIEEAETQLSQLIELNVMLSGPAYNMAVLQYQKNNQQQAINYAQIAIDRNAYNQDARNLLAVISRQMNDFSKAEKLHKENLSIWGGYAEGYKNLGVLYDLYMGKPELAMPYYQQYNALFEENNRQVLGWVLDIKRRLIAQDQALAQQKADEALASQEAEAQSNSSDQSSTQLNQSTEVSDE